MKEAQQASRNTLKRHLHIISTCCMFCVVGVGPEGDEMWHLPYSPFGVGIGVHLTSNDSGGRVETHSNVIYISYLRAVCFVWCELDQKVMRGGSLHIRHVVSELAPI